ncbi:MAG: phytoene desaturase family protein [Verrucomicrobiota bacterium]
MNRPDKSTVSAPAAFHAVVVGAGLGGMASAARLARLGARVTLIEKNAALGGKVAELRQDGFRWDIGPSLLTMPEVIHDLANDLEVAPPELKRLDNVCRYFWSDGHQIDADEAFCQRPEVAAFLDYARGIYELSGEAYLRHPPEEFWRAFSARNWPKLVHLPKIANFRTMSQELHRHFQDPYLIQLFERFATYNGSNPHQTPATFNIIPYVENAFGAWYPVGGMRSLALWLEQILRDLGVEIHTDTLVTQFDGHRVQTNQGAVWEPDAVICNGEAFGAHERWIRAPKYRQEQSRIEPEELSLSGYVLLLGVSRQYRQLRHHNIFFSDDYDHEFAELFEHQQFPSDPTIYVNLSSATTPEDAPAGHDNFFILVNAPAETERIDWHSHRHVYDQCIISKLERMGLEDLSNHIVTHHHITPADFAQRDLSTQGALYGAASNSIKSALFRPPLQSPIDPKLFFVGGSTHPGGGIPLVLLSAQMVTEAIQRKFDFNQSSGS